MYEIYVKNPDIEKGNRLILEANTKEKMTQLLEGTLQPYKREILFSCESEEEFDSKISEFINNLVRLGFQYTVSHYRGYIFYQKEDHKFMVFFTTPTTKKMSNLLQRFDN